MDSIVPEVKMSTAVETEDIVCYTEGLFLQYGFVTQSYNDDTSSSENEEEEEGAKKVSKKVGEGFAKVAWFNIGFGDGRQQETKVGNKKLAEQQIVSEKKVSFHSESESLRYANNNSDKETESSTEGISVSLKTRRLGKQKVYASLDVIK